MQPRQGSGRGSEGGSVSQRDLSPPVGRVGFSHSTKRNKNQTSANGQPDENRRKRTTTDGTNETNTSDQNQQDKRTPKHTTTQTSQTKSTTHSRVKTRTNRVHTTHPRHTPPHSARPSGSGAAPLRGVRLKGIELKVRPPRTSRLRARRLGSQHITRRAHHRRTQQAVTSKLTHHANPDPAPEGLQEEGPRLRLGACPHACPVASRRLASRQADHRVHIGRGLPIKGFIVFRSGLFRSVPFRSTCPKHSGPPVSAQCGLRGLYSYARSAATARPRRPLKRGQGPPLLPCYF